MFPPTNFSLKDPIVKLFKVIIHQINRSKQRGKALGMRKPCLPLNPYKEQTVNRTPDLEASRLVEPTSR